jgi:predicted ATPase
VAEQATSIDPRVSEPRLVDRLAELSGGVPFLVEQLVLAGVDATGPVPASVWEPMRTRLLGLDTETLRLVQLAALAEGFLDHQLLRSVWLDAAALRAGRPDTDDTADTVNDTDGKTFDAAVTAAVHQRVLVFDPVDNSYAFTHALLREAVASTLGPGDRLAWHRCWATQLLR